MVYDNYTSERHRIVERPVRRDLLDGEPEHGHDDPNLDLDHIARIECIDCGIETQGYAPMVGIDGFLCVDDDHCVTCGERLRGGDRDRGMCRPCATGVTDEHESDGKVSVVMREHRLLDRPVRTDDLPAGAEPGHDDPNFNTENYARMQCADCGEEWTGMTEVVMGKIFQSGTCPTPHDSCVERR